MLIVLVVAFIFCGASTAGEPGAKQPAVDGSRIVWTQTDSAGNSVIHVKDLATGKLRSTKI